MCSFARGVQMQIRLESDVPTVEIYERKLQLKFPLDQNRVYP
ncbi:unnamed protein product [Periconia digitata]|uniref:Uncharacterized protein n=1 Tax=Periconia digitata TaxID=1303443 RepID=A0A9W4UFH7_9PLEO|nr:unnamed protein product [Periconia digitata]